MAAEPPAHIYTFDRVVRMLLTAAVVVVLFILVRFLAGVLIPFVAAAVLAYVLNPLVTAVGMRIRQRWLAVTATFAGLVIVLLALCLAGGWLAVLQFQRFSTTAGNLLQTYREVLSTIPTSSDSRPGESVDFPPNKPSSGTDRPFPGSPEQGVSAKMPSGESSPGDPWLKRELNVITEAFRELLSPSSSESTTGGHEDIPAYESDRWQRDRFRRFWNRVAGTELFKAVAKLVPPDFSFSRWALSMVGRLFEGGWLAVTSGLHALFLVITFCILVGVYLFFLLLDYPQYVAMGREYLPPRYREDILAFLSEFDLVLRRYLRGQFVVAMCTGVILAVGFSIIGLPLAIPLGLFIGLLNMVPYLQLVMLPVVAMFALLRPFETPGATVIGSLIGVAVVLVLAQVIQDTLLTPRIMGKATGLKPVLILLGVFIWGKLLGLLGLLLAIPLTSLGIAYYRRLVLKHESRSDLPATSPNPSSRPSPPSNH